MVENAEIIESVRTLPARVAAELEGLSENELRWRPADDAWSIKEVVGHLRDDSEVWRRRLYMMITKTEPVLPAYDQEALVREREYQDADLGAIIGDFQRFRLDVAENLKTLTGDGWERTGQHPDWGQMTVREGMERMVRHTEGHLDQIRQMKESIIRARATAGEP